MIQLIFTNLIRISYDPYHFSQRGCMHVPIEIKEMQRKSEVVHISTGFSFGKVYVEVPHYWPIAVIYFSRVSSM